MISAVIMEPIRATPLSVCLSKEKLERVYEILSRQDFNETLDGTSIVGQKQVNYFHFIHTN